MSVDIAIYLTDDDEMGQKQVKPTAVDPATSTATQVATPVESPLATQVATPAGSPVGSPLATPVSTTAATAATSVPAAITPNETDETATIATELSVVEQPKVSSIPKQISSKHMQLISECLEQLAVFSGKREKTSISRMFRSIIKRLIPRSFEPGQDILKKGEECSGIYFIVDGSAVIVTEDGSSVIYTLTPGQFFGEVSTVFKLPITARVQADSRCDCYQLEKEHVWALLSNINRTVDIIDWFVARKYIPTSDSLDSQRTYRRMLLNSFQELPIFQSWSELSVKNLILSLPPEAVVLYPPNSLVLCEGDPGHIAHVLLRGSAVITGRSGVRVETSPIKFPILLGEAGLFLETKSCLNVTTLTECLVVSIRLENILSCMEEGMEDWSTCKAVWDWRRSQWEEHVQRHAHLEVPRDIIQYEVIFQYLSNSALFHNSTLPLLHQLAREAEVLHVKDGVLAYSQFDSKQRSLLLVLGGKLEIVDRSEPSKYPLDDLKTVSQGQLIAKLPGMPANITYRSVGDSFIIKFSTNLLKQTLQKFTSKKKR